MDIDIDLQQRKEKKKFQLIKKRKRYARTVYLKSICFYFCCYCNSLMLQVKLILISEQLFYLYYTKISPVLCKKKNCPLNLISSCATLGQN